MEQFYESLRECIFDGEAEQAAALTRSQLEQGMEPIQVIREYLSPILDEVGEEFARLEIFLPDVVIAAEVATAVKDVVSEYMTADPAGEKKGRVILGTVQGDVHDIGKNIVATLLAVNGYQVTDLGNDVAPIRFIEAAEREGADIIGLSSLLTTSMPYMKDVIKTLNGMGKRQQYQIIVGGGPVSAPWAAEIGADGYSNDANEAVALCDKLMAARQA